MFVEWVWTTQKSILRICLPIFLDLPYFNPPTDRNSNSLAYSLTSTTLLIYSSSADSCCVSIFLIDRENRFRHLYTSTLYSSMFIELWSRVWVSSCSDVSVPQDEIIRQWFIHRNYRVSFVSCIDVKYRVSIMLSRNLLRYYFLFIFYFKSVPRIPL